MRNNKEVQWSQIDGGKQIKRDLQRCQLSGLREFLECSPRKRYLAVTVSWKDRAENKRRQIQEKFAEQNIREESHAKKGHWRSAEAPLKRQSADLHMEMKKVLAAKERPTWKDWGESVILHKDGNSAWPASQTRTPCNSWSSVTILKRACFLCSD